MWESHGRRVSVFTSTFFYILCTKYPRNEFVVWARYSFSHSLTFFPSFILLDIFDFWFYFIVALSKETPFSIHFPRVVEDTFFLHESKVGFGKKIYNGSQKQPRAKLIFLWDNITISLYSISTHFSRWNVKSHQITLIPISFWNTKYNLLDSISL